MFEVSRKSRYALRALFELALRFGEGPVRVEEIARRQEIPPRYLAVIIHELKRGGFVLARRGNMGGYQLARDPRAVSVAEVLEYIEGGASSGGAMVNGSGSPGSLAGGLKIGAAAGRSSGAEVLAPLWSEAAGAMWSVFERTTLAGLVSSWQETGSAAGQMYCI